MNVWTFEPRWDDGWNSTAGEVRPCASVWLADVCVWSKNDPWYAFEFTDDESHLRDQETIRAFAYELQSMFACPTSDDEDGTMSTDPRTEGDAASHTHAWHCWCHRK